MLKLTYYTQMALGFGETLRSKICVEDFDSLSAHPSLYVILVVLVVDWNTVCPFALNT